jgi:hypothetical protein
MTKQKVILSKQKANGIKPDVKSRLRWLDAEKERPKAKQEIIFIDAVGMYKGRYSTIGNGQVRVDDGTDIIYWDNIYQWIEYPEEP